MADDSPISTSDFASPQVGAGAPSTVGSFQPLNGRVQSDLMRIRRSELTPATNTALRGAQPTRLTGTIEKNKVTVPQTTLVESADYSTALTTPAQPPKKRGTMMWMQSLAGGYYDVTQQVKEVIRGDELYKYGGKFADGVEVPDYPVTCNFAGHTYRPFVRKLARN